MLQTQHAAVPVALSCCVRVRMSSLQIASLPVAGVTLIDWSRTGAFITTAQRPGKGPDGQQAKNVKVRGTAAASC